MSESQKFLSRNRAPRVQIEYDVELYGAEKKVQLPFVMGVLSDLSGKAEKPAVADRKFLEIDADNFDERMRGVAPRVQFTVPNTLTGEGSVPVDLTFNRMEDFSPAAIAARVEGLAPLLEARQQLTNLLAYMDGKPGAEKLIETLLSSQGLLSALAGGAAQASDMDNALAALRESAPTSDAPQDTSAETALDALRAATPAEAPEEDSSAEVLGSMRRTPEAEAPQSEQASILAGLERVEDLPVEDAVSDVLAGLERSEEAEAPDETEDILSGIEHAEDAAPVDNSDDILAGIPSQESTPEDSPAEDILAGLDRASETQIADETSDILADLERAEATLAPDTAAEDILSGIERTEDVSVEDDINDILAGIELSPEAPSETSTQDILSGVERSEDVTAEDDLDDILSGLELSTETSDESADQDVLSGIERTEATPLQDETADILATLDAAPETAQDDGLEDILAGLEAKPEDSASDDMGSILSSLESFEETASESGLDDILAGLEAVDDDDGTGDEEDVLANLTLANDPEEEADGIDDILAGLNDAPEKPGSSDFDSVLAGLETEEDTPAHDDLGNILAGLDLLSEEGGAEHAEDPLAGLDAPDDADTALDDLLSDNAAESRETSPETSEFEDLLSDILGDDSELEGAPEAPPAGPTAAPQVPFGTLSAVRPGPESLKRSKFRIALFGDFTGRAARGVRETGDALAARAPIELDVDTVEDVIEGFATKLLLPIGKDGTAVEVPLGGLDDLHPDELYENVAIFHALSGLRQELNVGSMAGKAAERLKGWSERFGTPVRLPTRSAATSVPANRKLSDFQALIGDHSGALDAPSPIEDLLARIVGPHLVHTPNADARAMIAAVDEAATTAMRLVLHHPDFQAVEAQWRTLDMLARRVETDSSLQIVLYDISAEEIAMDLAAQEDLAQSGLFRLLTDVLDPETGTGGFSALMGLYVFEETPPHAELLARIAKVAAQVDAPFVAAISPGYLETEKEDRHPLVAKAWDQLRALPEAAWLGLASPRFLLRLPYGSRTDPVDPFDFEEFSPREGLSGLLWANPVALVAILLAATFKKDGRAMRLGSLMSLGDLPFHYVTDRHGDQVAMPCTERNLTTDPAQKTLARGFMPVVWMKGRNEVRLGSFNSVGGGELRGPWSGQAPPSPTKPPAPDIAMTLPIEEVSPQADELDDLLAAFEEDLDLPAPGGDNDDEMDAELAALLEGL